MTYTLPLASLPPAPGGRLKPTVYLLYNSKLYDTTVRICDSRCQFSYTETNVVRAADGGWRYGVRYSLRSTNRSTNYLAGPTTTQATYKFKTSVVFPDGSSHPVNPLGYTPVDDYFSVYPGQLASPMTYYSTDGSYFRVTVQPGQSSWTISFADGTTVHVNEQTGVQTTTDGNGNYFTVHGVTLPNGNPATLVTDQLRRKITLEDAPGGPDYVRASGFGGSVERVTTVNWGSTSPQGKRYLWRVYGDDDIETYKNLSITHQVVTSVTLPNGLPYQFQYNSDALDPNNPTKSVGWGELSQATLPTGAVVKYGYAMNNRHDENDLFGPVAPRDVLKNHPTTKQLTYAVTYDGTGTQRTDNWGYSFAFGFFDEVVTGQVAGPDGGVTREHFYPDNGSTSYDRDGLSYKTEQPDGSTVERRWEENWAAGASGSTVNMYVKTEYVSIKNAAGAFALTAVKDYDYDQNGNLLQVAEYDWMPYGAVVRDGAGRPTGVPAQSYLRRVTVNAYYSPTTNAANVYNQPTAPALRNAVESSEVRSGFADTSALSRAEFVYDNSATTGNLTQEKRWDSTRGALSRPLNAANRVLTQHGYDAYGNRTSTTDPKNNTTYFSYGDATHANLTGTTSAVPDPSNVRATNAPLTTSTVYDYSTGLVVSTTDANGKVTTFSYADDGGNLDPIDRLRKVTRPDGGWTKYVYYDTAVTASGVAAVETLTSLDATRTVNRAQFFDGLGRPTRSFLSVGTCYETTDTQYDAMGRVWRVSNPYCSSGSQSAINPPGRWTTTQYDLLGRATSVTAPDGAVTATAYDGNSATVTDPAGKQKRTVTDALGRLTSAVEAPNNADYNYLTTYDYDALGKLRKVDQGGQQRFFMYDSLSRLVRSKLPEQAVNANLNTGPDPVSGNAQWSAAYDYDLNSNLWHRTDARGVVTTYTYDNLNRVIRTDYSDSTPFTLNTWDFATNGRGRFYANYESSTSGTINYVFAYDAAGRATSRRTDFYLNGAGWVGFYSASRAYDRAGNVTSQTYPSGRTVSYNYDAAGRLADNGGNPAFSGNLGDGVTRTYAGGVTYDEASRVLEERFGTATPLYHKRLYNARGQLFDVRLSSVGRQQDPLDWNRGALLNYYSQQGGWTPGGSGTDNNGNVLLAQHWVPDGQGGYNWMNQYYEYDPLNRITHVKEQQNGVTYTAQQHYTYDRWGNRKIDAAGTWLGQPSNPPSPLLNETQFELNPQANQEVAEPSNRLYAPGDANRAPTQKRMRYDAAGNLKYDAYTSAGARDYDAEGRMTAAWGYSATTGGPFQSRYVYDAGGKRMRRQTDAGEAWHVYGFDGELIAEYAANGSPAQPQKEYGYRGGALLVVAESGGQVRWLVADHLGTPRMTVDQTGSLAGVRRHDYLPFGEEVGVGGRTATQGYDPSDNIRQKFTGYERDRETSLDYAQARYYAPAHGRFTSPDPLQSSASPADPQSFNRYAYALNNPVRYTDPTGMLTVGRDGSNTPDSGFDLMSFSAPQIQQQVFVTVITVVVAPVAASASSSSTAAHEAAHAPLNGAAIAPLEVLERQDNATMVIIWAPASRVNPVRAFGHVSYVFMQKDKSLSWQADGTLLNEWTVNVPSSDYTAEKSKQAAGVGYILDFYSAQINRKFQMALEGAFRSRAGVNYPYHPTDANCGTAFVVAFNAIRKDINMRGINFILPSKIQGFIENNLRKYTVGTVDFPKR